MDQAQPEFPPGTVGHLARRRGLDTRASEAGSEPERNGQDTADGQDTAASKPVAAPSVGEVDVSIPEQQTRERRNPVGEPEDDPFAYFAPAGPYVPTERYQVVEPRRPVEPRAEDELGAAGYERSPTERSELDTGSEADAGSENEEGPESDAGSDSAARPGAEDRLAAEARPAAESGPAGSPAPRAERSGNRSVARWVEPGALAAEQAQRARTGALVRGDRRGATPTGRSGRRAPTSGWRHMLLTLSRGLINPGEGSAELRRRLLTTRVNQPLHGCYKVAMLSLKGGVGKTTVTATLGATFASLRGDRVVAVDANPDRGTLSQKIPLETSATVRHLLRDVGRVRRYNDVRAYTSQGPSRLEVLASEQDPAASEAFSEQDYRRAVTLLEHFYNIVLTDCGTGLMHSAMYGVLGLADALVIVSSGSIDGARSASATMDWLDAHGHRDLVANSVAVINSVRRSSGQVDLGRVAEHFAARCRAVVRIPYDSHLEEGAELDVDRLAPATRIALLELAASVADAFPRAEG